ncbi:MAG: circadian clock protein KaiA [Cyanobium sp. M30B3]|jgi:circadian clock protein KaiA|nr:MAG: circadian clock protein KaiA [Cyanobium sp. M30B3]
MPESALTIVSLIRDPSLQEAVTRWLDGQTRYRLVPCAAEVDPVPELERLGDSCDALLLQQGELAPEAAQALQERGLVLPAVVIGRVLGQVDYHPDEIHLSADQLEQLTYSLDAAISRSLSRVLAAPPEDPGVGREEPMPERWRLANRLQARLGLLGVFYKRDSSRFLRNLDPKDAEILLESLKRTYRDLLFSYFKDPAAANQALESFVNTAFFSDLPITRTVEIHMDLIDSFSKQLSLEGHKSDFLQDYRLALLDVMAHLCEMYRRSIPAGVPLAPAMQGL